MRYAPVDVYKRQAALQEDGLVGASGALEQREVLHVAGADLDHIGVLIDQVERFVIDGFGDDEQAEAVADFGHDLQTFFAQALEGIRRGARFVGCLLYTSLAAVEESSADVLCISTTILANLPSVAELVRVVRSKLSDRVPKIVLGGTAYRLATQFAQEVGATGINDLRHALATLAPS